MMKSADTGISVRIIVCGGRHFDDYNRMRSTIDGVIAEIGSSVTAVEIVSGHCAGADQLGEKYAEEHGYPCKVFPANWEKHGRVLSNHAQLDVYYVLDHRHRVLDCFHFLRYLHARPSI